MKEQKEREEILSNKYNDLKYYMSQMNRQELEQKVVVLFTNYIDLKHKVKYIDDRLVEQNQNHNDTETLKQNYEEIKQKYQMLVEEQWKVKRENAEWKQKIDDLDEFIREHQEIRQKMVTLYVVVIDYISWKADQEVVPFQLNIEAIRNGSKVCLK